MQWILQDFEDTPKLTAALDDLGIPYSTHKVVPFVGELLPPPQIIDQDKVVLFGAYTLWRTAEDHGYRPGVFKLRPFLHEAPWQPFMLNGTEALVMELRDVPKRLPSEDVLWFMRPVDDSKEEPGKVRSAAQIHDLAEQVLRLNEEELPIGSLRHDTELMFTQPAQIGQEWRIWVVGDTVVTWSLYKEAGKVTWRHEITEDALAFAKELVSLNPGYADAYVLDICSTPEGMRMLETNCINAAGFYEADMHALVTAIEGLTSPRGLQG